MLWEILICTLEERKDKFTILHQHIAKQIVKEQLIDEVGILFFADNRKYPVGMKRNTLLKTSTADYTCFVDDDDWVSDTYVKDIYGALKSKPPVDCVGFKGLVHSVGWDYADGKTFTHSLKYDHYFEDKEGYKRPPNHLNPMKREYALQIGFALVNCGEDTDFALKLSNSQLLQEEAFIDDIMYIYNFNIQSTATQTGLKQSEHYER